MVLALFPHSNRTFANRRPALVVQDGDLGTGLRQAVVAMITSNMGRAGHPSRVTVLQNSSEGQQMGLQMDSVIMTDNLATVLERQIDRSLGTCADMDAVDAALRHTLGL